MLTTEEKDSYFTKVRKQLEDGVLLQTKVIVCSDSCQESKMLFKLAFKNTIIQSYLKQSK
jgi:hypothetical protein|tara:strand:+ start:95 stop:274 length:180 start_codon:yes stop_codon:yes gene_type:complete